ncbi:MAG: tetratricopeptide repeat protein [Gemmatimonadetes bacterium]|uniref:Tetratricopeptide repeat protein n=1 Tax=Candidatus Kutchimonas denitrificans TaxID=3056748 RepID=A0AAE4ZCF2_9BACT|nr:tetratricopeptide repeat protein [Gemmatimonadota bacterium]NIR75100.1 tetratricopeptide repeat protein [Candidatus Kutchimonas denitrificans]NIS00932.1 tetratricopeptide repeat protein [Gemmatimonadota bacterium]NIT66549.1 tetratricopeptide repeat protein [Gemmatimonadota bacterium]NIU52895.1 tetratricopeptide repeat protein [Gemmatimonadota bacterium]
MEEPKKKYASEIERRRRPLKDVDAEDRAQFIRAAVWLAPVSLVFFMFVTAAATDIWGMGPGMALLVGLILGLAGPWLAYGLVYRYVIGGTANLLGKLYYSSEATPQPPTSWRAQALSVRGSHAEALQALQEEVAQYPDDPGPCLKAAAFCWQELDEPEAAIAFYERARKLPGIAAETDQYITIRLADIYESLGRRGPAMRELRRLLDRHPDSHYSAGARTRLAGLKWAASESEPDG